MREGIGTTKVVCQSASQRPCNASSATYNQGGYRCLPGKDLRVTPRIGVFRPVTQAIRNEVHTVLWTIVNGPKIVTSRNTEIYRF